MTSPYYGVSGPAPIGQRGRTVREINAYLTNNAVINVKDYGAVGDASVDDTLAIQAAVDNAQAGDTIVFPGPGRYLTTAPIVVSQTAERLTFEGWGGAQLLCAHNGDGLVLVSQNENYSRHVVKSLRITGPNTPLPAGGYVPTSTGAAICLSGRRVTDAVAAYSVSIRDCQLECFNAGIEMQNVIGCTVDGRTHIRWNQYGVFIDGGQTNVNTFTGIMIRENRKAGVYFADGAPATNPNQNNFIGCLIESNVAYPAELVHNPDPTMGGVVIRNAYDNHFIGCYFENHNFSVVISDSSDQSRFVSCYFASSGVRISGVLFQGPAIVNTTFRDCNYQGAAGVPNVKFSDVYARNTNPKNTFIDCAGWVFADAVTDTGGRIASLDIIRHKTNQAGGGTPIGILQLPTYGYADNVADGVGRGLIDVTAGIALAVLDVNGLGEIQFGNGITGARTIVGIRNVRPNSLLVLKNLQTAFGVTIKSSASYAVGDIQLQNNRSVTLKKAGQTLFLWVDGAEKIVEIGRNFSNRVRGIVQISDANTFADVVFAGLAVPIPDEPDVTYAAMFSVDTTTGGPAAGAWLISAANYAVGGFRIVLNAAPGVGKSIFIQWEAIR